MKLHFFDQFYVAHQPLDLFNFHVGSRWLHDNANNKRAVSKMISYQKEEEEGKKNNLSKLLFASLCSLFCDHVDPKATTTSWSILWHVALQSDQLKEVMSGYINKTFQGSTAHLKSLLYNNNLRWYTKQTNKAAYHKLFPILVFSNCFDESSWCALFVIVVVIETSVRVC